ncbi:MAG: hypothetical protein PHR35_15915 [Kiritimatiellae bacterium]|nr:hypothetical protein [Kiritimatiellia bacterium]
MERNGIQMSGGGTRTDWLHEAKWGVFMHYLAVPAGSSQGEELDAETWNRRVDAFDLPGVVRQLREIRPGYVVITLGQNSGHYCTPNATYDRITGVKPGKCSRRDLVAELAEALAPHGIRVLVYLTGSVPEYAPEAVKAFEWVKGARSVSFQRKWESVIREWSLRWGRRVHGWWFDCCYYADTMYRLPEEPNFKSFAAAVRAGNPDSLVSWNVQGITTTPHASDPEEDFTAGEVNEPRDVDAPGRWDQHAQFHILTYLGRTWGQLPIRFDAAEAIAHTLELTDCGGVVTWDAPHSWEGLIDPGAFSILKAIGRAVAATRGTPDKAPPRVVRPWVTFFETPGAAADGVKTGRIRLALQNQWPERIAGEVALSIAPPSAGCIEGEATVAYTVEPGGAAQAEVGFRLRDTSPEAPSVHLQLSRSLSKRTLLYTFPRRERVELPRLAMPASIETLARAMEPLPWRMIRTGGGQTVAEVKLAVTDGHLAIVSKVTDSLMRRTPNVHDGSCMEVFGMAEPGETIKQIILAPANSDAPAVVLLVERDPESPSAGIHPTSNVQYCSSTNHTGYTSATLIPLPWWLKRATAPDQFLLEVVVTAGGGANLFERSALFGPHEAAFFTDGYASIACEAEGQR